MVWDSTHGKRTLVHKTTLEPGTDRWSIPTYFAGPGGESAYYAEVAATHGGRIAAIWLQSDFGSADRVHVGVLSSARASSNLDIHFLSSAGRSAEEPRIIGTSNERFAAVWYSRGDGRYRVQVSLLGDTEWSVPGNLSAKFRSRRGLAIAASADGSLTVVWSLLKDGHSRVQASRCVIGEAARLTPVAVGVVCALPFLSSELTGARIGVLRRICTQVPPTRSARHESVGLGYTPDGQAHTHEIASG